MAKVQLRNAEKLQPITDGASLRNTRGRVSETVTKEGPATSKPSEQTK